MSYKIEKYSQDDYEFVLYDNAKKLRDWQQIKASMGPRCVGIVNLGYFAMTAIPSKGIKYFDHQCAVMIDGVWAWKPTWNAYGLHFEKSGKLSVCKAYDAKSSFIECVQSDYVDGARPNATYWGKNGVTYTGLTADGTVVCMLCSKDDGLDSAQSVKIMRDAGCVTVLRWDGSWSSRGTLGVGKDVAPSQYRMDRTWMLIMKKENKEEPIVPTDKTIDGVKPAFITKNRCYTNQVKCDKKKMMIHSTATPGAMASNIANSMDSNAAVVSVELVVDDTGAYQLLPIGIKSWHCGASANNTHIACEVCEPEETAFIPINWQVQYRGNKSNRSYVVKRIQQELVARGFNPNGTDGSFGPGCEFAVKAFQKSVGLTADGYVGPSTLAKLQNRDGSFVKYNVGNAKTYFDKAYANAVDLFAKVLKLVGGNSSDIVSHAEGYRFGIASNHADVGHWFPLHGKSMDDFRHDVEAKMGGNTTAPLSVAVDKLFAKGIIDSPGYWKVKAYSNDNVEALIIKVANAL